MKEVKCDFCNKVIDENKPRIRANVQEVRNEIGAFIQRLVYDSMDFCNVHCLANFICNKAAELAESE